MTAIWDHPCIPRFRGGRWWCFCRGDPFEKEADGSIIGQVAHIRVAERHHHGCALKSALIESRGK